MFSEKKQNVYLAVLKVRSLRQKRNEVAQNFRCVRQDDNGSYVDDLFGGVHIVEPMNCMNYDANEICKKFDCPNHAWNRRYIDLLDRLRAAKRERNMAILDLFRIKHK